MHGRHACMTSDDLQLGWCTDFALPATVHASSGAWRQRRACGMCRWQQWLCPVYTRQERERLLDSALLSPSQLSGTSTEFAML